MEQNKYNTMAARILAAMLALGIWELGARWLDNRLLLAGPWEVLTRLWELLPRPEFRQAVLATTGRITAGFLLAFAAALILASAAARFPLAEVILSPWFLVIRTVPVASFIVMALLWLSGKRVSIFISFLMVLPVLYANSLQGLRSADRKLLEMARVFRMPMINRIRCIRLPALRPYLIAGCQSALGLCWKAGVAAEVIGVSSGSIGGMIYDAKVYLEIADLFAWTVTVVLISVAFEKLFIFVLRKILDRLEGI